MAKDYYKVIEGMEELGAVPKTADINILETTVSYAVEKIRRLEREQRTWNDMSFEELSGVEDYRYLRKFNIGLNDLMRTFSIPQGWVALERVMGHLMAIITRIAPRKTMGQVAKPYLSKLILDDYEGLKELFNKQSRTFAHNIADLPFSANRLMNHFLRGRGKVSVQNLEKHLEAHTQNQKQLVWTLFTLFAGAVSVVGYLQGIDLLFFNSFLLSLFGLTGTLRLSLPRKKRPDSQLRF
jgi:predicted unusual protein kinase regulating ubiquinone biosynthesis (AarF/ABC1/UbiB family)